MSLQSLPYTRSAVVHGGGTVGLGAVAQSQMGTDGVWGPEQDVLMLLIAS